MASTVVGLEITEESVRAAEVTTRSRPTLVAFGEVALPEGAARDSEVLDREAIAVALQQLWAQSGITSRRVILGVGSRRILVREYAAPVMSLELIKAALPFQVQDMLPVPANQAVLDFYPIEEDQGSVQGLLVAAVSEGIEELVETMRKAKLRTHSVDLVRFGPARVARSPRQPGGGATAMIHVGEHTTYVTVAANGIPRFVRIIPAEISTPAKEHRATVEILEREPVEVAVVTDRGGRASMRVARAQATLSDDAAGSVSDLATRVRSTLDFYSARHGAHPIAAVHVSGAGMTNPAILPQLQATLGRPVSAVEIGALVDSRRTAPEGALALNLVGTVGILLGVSK